MATAPSSDINIKFENTDLFPYNNNNFDFNKNQPNKFIALSNSGRSNIDAYVNTKSTEIIDANKLFKKTS